VLTMQPQAGQVFQLLDAQEQLVGQVTVERTETWSSGALSPIWHSLGCNPCSARSRRPSIPRPLP
jgi:hypothetical protein